MNKYIDDLMSQDYDDDKLIPNKIHAVEMLIKLKDKSYLPDLYEVLDDAEDFWTKELAASVLAELDGANALERLLNLLIEGIEIDRDNDDLRTTIVTLVKRNKAESKAVLENINSSDPKMKELVEWALGLV